MRPIRARIFRYDPTRDEKPRYEVYELPREKGMRVLCFLERLREQGSDLAFGHSCGMAKCGTCAVAVNGRPVLACLEPAKDNMLIEPLQGFPVLRDLVIDSSEYQKALVDVEPY